MFYSDYSDLRRNKLKVNNRVFQYHMLLIKKQEDSWDSKGFTFNSVSNLTLSSTSSFDTK